MQQILAILKRLLRLLLPVLLALASGAVLILAAGANPFTTYANLFSAGFSCAPGPGRCDLVTSLTFATPLIFSGLAATVALRGGFFSLGQLGQMVVGAAAAAWVGSRIPLPDGIHPAAALTAAAFFGGLWGLLPALLKEYVGVNEIISTLLLNPIAGVAVGIFPGGRLSANALLAPLVPSTKLNAGFIVSLTCAALVFVVLWRTTRGLEIRTTAQAPSFARYGGIRAHFPVLGAMLFSGALAGVGGAVEVLGTQYRFVTSFSTFTDFDGLIVAFVAHLHPLAVIAFAILLGGLRNGSIVGLQIQSHIPNELGGAIIALILLFVATNRLAKPFAGVFSQRNVAASKPPAAPPA